MSIRDYLRAMRDPEYALAVVLTVVASEDPSHPIFRHGQWPPSSPLPYVGPVRGLPDPPAGTFRPASPAGGRTDRRPVDRRSVDRRSTAGRLSGRRRDDARPFVRPFVRPFYGSRLSDGPRTAPRTDWGSNPGHRSAGRTGGRP